MNINCQSYFTLENPGANIDKSHELFTLYYLFQIFKECNTDLFDICVGPGHPRIYTPEIMVPFIQWGHLNKIISCRELENWWTRNDDTCNFILDCKKPSKSTINEFLRKFNYLISEFDKFLIDFSLLTGLISGNTIFHDGTFLKGNCNNFKKLYANQIYHLRDFILSHRHETSKNGLWYKLDKYFNKNKFIDEIKPILNDLEETISSNGINLLKSIFKSKNGLFKVLKRIKQMEENVKGNQPVSIVDPEAHIMLDKNNQWGFNYNYQVGVDGKYGMMTIHYITQNPNDKKELPEVIKHANSRFHQKSYVLVVDNGYWHIKSLKDIHHSPVTIIIPDRASAARKKEEIKKENNNNMNEKKDFKKHKFIKNWKNDTYKCPNGSILTRQNNIIQNNIEYKVYATNNCLKCPDQKICSSEPKRKIKDRNDQEINEIKKTYHSQWGQKTYQGRGTHAEGNFGTLKESRNFRGIKTRGTKRVNNELTQYAITHNIKKIHKHMNNKVLETILKLIKQEKTKHKKVNINILTELIDKYIIEDDMIVDLELK